MPLFLTLRMSPATHIFSLATVLQHAQLEVLLKLHEGHGCLLRNVEELRLLNLLWRGALEHVFFAALLAAHADVSIDAAQRPPLAAGLSSKRACCERGMPRRGEDNFAGGPVVQEDIYMNPTSASSKFFQI